MSLLHDSPSGGDGEPGSPRAVERLRVLANAALSLSGSHERDELLVLIVEAAASVADARFAALGIYDDSGDLATFIHHGIEEATVAAIGSYPKGRGLLGQVIIADQPVRLDDLSTHPSSCGFPANHPPMVTFLGVPVAKGGRRYGNLYLCDKVDGAPFDDTDEAFVLTLASFAAGAIETTELLVLEVSRAAAAEQARARRELLGRVIAAQEAERARVSRDLHDDVGQALTSVLLGLRLLEDCVADSSGSEKVADVGDRVADLRDLVTDALRRTRRLAFDLRPTVLDDIGLVPALRRLADDLAAHSGIVFALDLAGLAPDERLPPEIETVIYRVAQEALTNVLRHARATTASVTLSARGTDLRVFVEDDGAGFDSALRPEQTHLGIAGMVERAELVGGALQVISKPGGGTVVVLEVPRR
jgi:signal transduction histidine kinase